MKTVPFEELIGKVLVSVENQNDAKILFTADTGESWALLHEQDCCEEVDIEDIVGDLSDLVGSPIVRAEENSSNDEWPEDVPKPQYPDSFTWTFYRIGTIKGTVVIRWYGISNGYYSESVSFVRL
jgi:hypothetical protein